MQIERSQGLQARGKGHVTMFHGDIEWEVKGPGVLVPRDALTGRIAIPYEETDWLENGLTIGGASVQWETLIGTTPTGTIQYYNNANSHLSVGDSSTAFAHTQTELQAATNRFRKAMDATYPLHTDSTGTAGSKDIVYRSTFATGDANFAWNEWGLFNAAGTGGPPVTGGRMLNRAAGAGLLGTKVNTATWVLTATLSLA